LKFWRRVHKLSQEELAGRLGSSPRHISRLETGTCRASEAIVLQIGEVLTLGKRDLNHLLISAGYAPFVERIDFNSPELRWLRKAMILTLRALDPYPATLVDSDSQILMVNKGFVNLFTQVVPASLLAQITNNYDFVFGRSSTDSMVKDWEDTVSAIIMAGQQAALFSNNPEDQAQIDSLVERSGVPRDWAQRAAKMEPRSSFRVQVDLHDEVQNFFNVCTIVGSLGPAAFVSDPRLTINILYPEDDNLDLSFPADAEISHPLLFY
jgi:transcriptional regulator with XRE-family HTH domain